MVPFLLSGPTRLHVLNSSLPPDSFRQLLAPGAASVLQVETWRPSQSGFWTLHQGPQQRQIFTLALLAPVQALSDGQWWYIPGPRREGGSSEESV